MVMALQRQETGGVSAASALPIAEKHPTNLLPEEGTTTSPDSSGDEDSIDSGLLEGVKLAKATKRVLTTRQLILAYMLIWLLNFTQSLSNGIFTSLAPYITSSFQKHALTSTTTIIASLAAGLFQLPFAKILDLYGRAQGLFLMILFQTIGLIMMAACKNVETYCAAQVFYSIGYQGITFTATIFIADTCSLRERAFIMGITGTPAIASVWAAGPAAQSTLRHIGLRWAFGIWCIVTPIACTPWLLLLVHAQRKAITQGLVAKSSTPHSLRQSVLFFLKEIDAVGIIMLASGFSLFLLSFNLYTYQNHEWKSPMVICFIIFGALLIVLFPLYERYLAPKTFISWPILKDRTILSTFAADMFYYTSETAWGTYFYSILVVVFDKSITNATYINNTYLVGSTVWLVFIGLTLSKYGHIKHYALYFGLPLSLLATGLQIKFRTSTTSIGLVAMCQVFLALGGGTMYITEQLAVMAASPQENLPSALAILGIVVQVGKSVGGTIGTAIWTDVFPKKLAEFLPLEAKPYLPQIYGSLVTQTSFPPGSPQREAIVRAYEYASRLILIVATCLLAPCFFAVAFWRDYDVNTLDQNKRMLVFPSWE
ncbi:hypothetical protein AnigIFM50267_011796 [Aspergillus niger]|nr:hypothetical protein AnigIFM50267_011796 [Aspergillus niger]GLA19271.1 hypothetical protein AnigIFM62618_006940 [Aspergillus niger]